MSENRSAMSPDMTTTDDSATTTNIQEETLGVRHHEDQLGRPPTRLILRKCFFNQCILPILVGFTIILVGIDALHLRGKTQELEPVGILFITVGILMQAIGCLGCLTIQIRFWRNVVTTRRASSGSFSSTERHISELMAEPPPYESVVNEKCDPPPPYEEAKKLLPLSLDRSCTI